MNNKKGGYPWLLLFTVVAGGLGTLLFGIPGGSYIFFILILLVIAASILR